MAYACEFPLGTGGLYHPANPIAKGVSAIKMLLHLWCQTKLRVDMYISFRTQSLGDVIWRSFYAYAFTVYVVSLPHGLGIRLLNNVY